MDDDQTPAGPAWLPLSEAAQRLGISVDAVRKRARRGLVEVRKGNDGRLSVLVTGRTESGQEDSESGQGLDDTDFWRSLAEERATELARLKAELDGIKQVTDDRLAARDEIIAGRDREIARLEHRLEQLSRPWWRKLLG